MWWVADTASNRAAMQRMQGDDPSKHFNQQKRSAHEGEIQDLKKLVILRLSRGNPRFVQQHGLCASASARETQDEAETKKSHD